MGSSISDARDKLLFTPGPLTTSRTVKQAMLRDLGSRDARFIETVQRVRDKLLAVAGLSQPQGYECILMQGSGTFSIESVISSAISPSGELLVIVNGAYGQRIEKICARHGIDTVVVRCLENDVPSIREVERALAETDLIEMVAIVHCETTSGIINPIQEIGELVHRHGKRYFVDAMSSFGAVPFDFQACRIDYLVSSANKCIEGVPGFGYVLCRREALESTSGWARTVSLDLLAQWQELEGNGQFRFTPPTHTILAFDQALTELEQEGGVESRGDRYRTNYETLIQGMRAMGFAEYVPDGARGYIITSFHYPRDDHFEFEPFYRRLNDKGFVIYPGKVTDADCFRIGHIGHLESRDVEALLHAIHKVLLEMGITIPIREGTEGCRQQVTAWQVAEGDVNFTPERSQWQESQIDEGTRALLERDGKAFLHQSLSTPCLTSLAACEGIYLVDQQGRRMMDFHGNSAHQVGYRHPRVLEAIRAQLDVLPFCPRRFTNRPAIELAEKLGCLAPGRLQKVLFAPGGTSAIGIALKLARYATGRYKTISMWDSFHGASLDAISIGGERLFQDGLGPLLPGCFHVPWPREAEDVRQIERILHQEGDIGAIIAEPMRCTTVEWPPNVYWRAVRKLCDKHGALLVFDEISLALGRTGRMFCCELAEVVPDVLVIGKGLGGGVMPMAATIVREDLDVIADRALGHYTHEKSPVGAAAALATIRVIESEGLLDRAIELGDHALARLRQLQHAHALVDEVRGLGLALAVQLAGDRPAAASAAQRILYRCLARGLSFKISNGNVLTLTPPLTISRDQLDEALDTVQEAIEMEG